MTEKERPRPVRTARPEAKSDATHELQAKRSPDLRVVQSEDDEDLVGVEGFKPLIPDYGSFEAKLSGWRTSIIFNCPKVFLEFEIVSPGEWNGVRVFRAFRVRKLIGRPSAQGKFVMAPGGDLYQMLCGLFDYRTRADRVSLRPLKHMLFRIRMRTVQTNSKQERLPEHARYSTVADIRRGE